MANLSKNLTIGAAALVILGAGVYFVMKANEAQKIDSGKYPVSMLLKVLNQLYIEYGLGYSYYSEILKKKKQEIGGNPNGLQEYLR